MVTAAAFRKLALAQPGAVEAPHFDRASFRAGGRIFATLAADGKSAMLKLDLGAHEALLGQDPRTFFSFGAWSRSGATGVQLASIAPALLRELMGEAFRNVATRPARKRR